MRSAGEKCWFVFILFCLRDVLLLFYEESINYLFNSVRIFICCFDVGILSMSDTQDLMQIEIPDLEIESLRKNCELFLENGCFRYISCAICLLL
jgi:hypothetical protein